MPRLTFKTETVSNLVSAGTPQNLTTGQVICRKAYLQADAANTGTVTLFESGNVIGDGHVLDPGDILILDAGFLDEDRGTIEKFDLADIQFDGATTANKIRVNYVV